ncbi:hypothetical protein SOASR031_25810 [Leminorella grimontii]|nr:hypothetical protein SOASR031_25810 [Leminorella grimontii]
MNITFEWLFFLLLAVINIITAIFIFCSALHPYIYRRPAWYKLALIMTAFGFAAQGALSFPYLIYGYEIYNNSLPIWIFNDIGIAIISGHYFFKIILRK